MIDATGLIQEDAINIEKQPLHESLDMSMHSFRTSANAATGTTTTTTVNANKRGKVFPSSFLSPSSSVVDPAEYTLCLQCPTAVADSYPFKHHQREAEEESLPPIQTTIVLDNVGGGNDVAATTAAAPSRPTADDYANLFFCESSEEEEARASLLAASEPTKATGISTVAMASATARRKKRRRVSFGASVPAVHLLDDTPPSSAITPAERSASWFGRSDLELLKTSAQLCVQEMRNRIRSDGGRVRDRTEFRAAMVRMETETNSSVRGLEHRVFRRKHARRALIQDVLECQAHIKGLARFGHEMCGDEGTKLLAKASRERSTMARQMAFVDARDDYAEINGIVVTMPGGMSVCGC